VEPEQLGDGAKAAWLKQWIGARSSGDTMPGPRNEKPFYVLSRVEVAKIGLFSPALYSTSLFFTRHILSADFITLGGE